MIIQEKESITGDLLDDIILRGTDDIDFHISPTNKYILNVSELDSEPVFKKGVDLLLKHIKKDSKIALPVDQDLDGYTSASVFVKAMKELNVNIDALIDEGKTHGLTDNIMNDIIGNYDLVIIPDAGSNDIEQHKKLLDNDIDFIVLDHHEVKDEVVDKLNTSDNGIVINNQLLDINKNYTGVGMVYIFLKYVNFLENLNLDIDKYLDLVALGAIGDVSNVADKEIRYYVTKGLNNIINPFIKATMERKGLKEMTGRDASFSIISMVNAVTRVGTIEEKYDLFNAIVSDSIETTTVEVRKKNKSTGKFDKIPTEMTIHDTTVKKCESIKTKQDKIVKEAMKKVEYIHDNNVIIGLLDEDVPSSITGLVAMKVSDKHKRPTMIGKDYGGYIAGSARADIDFKDILNNSGLFEYAQGHQQAFGFKFNKSKMSDIDNLFNNLESKEREYLVDKVYTKPIEYDIYTVEMNKNVFGGVVEFPTMGYKNLEFNIRCINTRGSVTTFFDNGVSFILFNSPNDIKDVIESHLENNKITMDIIGSPRINKFGNKEIPQIVIEHYEFINSYDIIQEDEDKWGIDF